MEQSEGPMDTVASVYNYHPQVTQIKKKKKKKKNSEKQIWRVFYDNLGIFCIFLQKRMISVYSLEKPQHGSSNELVTMYIF